MGDLVEDLLLAELGARLSPRFLERLPIIGPRVARRRREQDEGHLLLSALEAVGLLSGEEVAAWQGRLAGALTDRAVTSDAWTPAARDRALRHLRELQAAGGAPAGDVARETYEEIGLLDPGAAGEWEHDADQPDDPEPADVALFEEELGWLQAVVLGPPEPRGGLRLVAAELYDGGVVIRWHRLRTAALPDCCREGGAEVTLRDALGTRYVPLEGSRGQSSDALGGSWWFAPGAPQACERLELDALGTSFVIEVDRP